MTAASLNSGVQDGGVVNHRPWLVNLGESKSLHPTMAQCIIDGFNRVRQRFLTGMNAAFKPILLPKVVGKRGFCISLKLCGASPLGIATDVM